VAELASEAAGAEGAPTPVAASSLSLLHYRVGTLLTSTKVTLTTVQRVFQGAFKGAVKGATKERAVGGASKEDGVTPTGGAGAGSDNGSAMIRIPSEGPIRDAAAVAHLQLALRLGPTDAEVREGLGTALLQQGEYERAVLHLCDTRGANTVEGAGGGAKIHVGGYAADTGEAFGYYSTFEDGRLIRPEREQRGGREQGGDRGEGNGRAEDGDRQCSASATGCSAALDTKTYTVKYVQPALVPTHSSSSGGGGGGGTPQPSSAIRSVHVVQLVSAQQARALVEAAEAQNGWSSQVCLHTHDCTHTTEHTRLHTHDCTHTIAHTRLHDCFTEGALGRSRRDASTPAVHCNHT
jgi:hypothetical protein